MGATAGRMLLDRILGFSGKPRMGGLDIELKMRNSVSTITRSGRRRNLATAQQLVRDDTFIKSAP